MPEARISFGEKPSRFHKMHVELHARKNDDSLLEIGVLSAVPNIGMLPGSDVGVETLALFSGATPALPNEAAAVLA